jgi:hypothetical protein
MYSRKSKGRTASVADADLAAVGSAAAAAAGTHGDPMFGKRAGVRIGGEGRSRRTDCWVMMMWSRTTAPCSAPAHSLYVPLVVGFKGGERRRGGFIAVGWLSMVVSSYVRLAGEAGE